MMMAIQQWSERKLRGRGVVIVVVAFLVLCSLHGSFRLSTTTPFGLHDLREQPSTVTKTLVDITAHPGGASSLQPRCLSFNESLAEMITKSNQLFMLMPAKAAGTSLHEFAIRCFRHTYPVDAFAREASYLRSFLTSSYELPKVVASHVSSENNLINLMKHTTDDTLMIFLYRNERDRLMSAIKHIVKSRMCGDWEDKGLSTHLLNTGDNACIIQEATLVDEIIGKRPAEIAMGAAGRLLTCTFYDTFVDTAPNMVFMHYRHANVLQQLVASQYCPNMKGTAKIDNNDAEKKEEAFVRLENGTQVLIDDWVHAKRNFLQLTLLMEKDASCRRQTKEIEKSLFACPDELIELAL
jgi:hypothetical protein